MPRDQDHFDKEVCDTHKWRLLYIANKTSSLYLLASSKSYKLHDVIGVHTHPGS